MFPNRLRLAAITAASLLLSISVVLTVIACRRSAFASPSLLLPSAGPSGAETLIDRYGRLLGKYVTPKGVRYTGWRSEVADVKALSAVVNELSAMNPKTLSDSDRTAHYINLYNAKVLEIVLTKNPKSSIKEITPGITGFGVFMKPAVTVNGKTISLRDLESRLRDESKDPRIHFAINCASKSCPPIASEPYRGETLDAQLDRSAHAFLASPGALVASPGGKPDKPEVTIECSKIFDWYSKDFALKGGAVSFIEKNGPPEVSSAIKAADGAARLVYQDYNWSLNEAS